MEFEQDHRKDAEDEPLRLSVAVAVARGYDGGAVAPPWDVLEQRPSEQGTPDGNPPETPEDTDFWEAGIRRCRGPRRGNAT